jgi:peptidyl-prolyl cis-trans isomerase SurA
MKMKLEKLSKFIALGLLMVLVNITGKAQQKPVVIDRIIAKVDNHFILSSDLEGAMAQYQSETNKPSSCEVLQQLVTSKLLLAKSEIDSVFVEDKAIDGELGGRMDSFIQRFGSEKNLVEAYGKSVEQLKSELRSQIKEQLVARKMQSTITENVKITPSEVQVFFNTIPKDSIPLMPREVEVGQIVRIAKATKEEKAVIRQRLVDIKKRIEAGEDFATLAKEFSEDLGSGQNGGNLGFAKRGMMVAEFEASALKLKPNQLSDIVESEFGFHLIQLLEIRGQEYNSRHILFRPDYAKLDMTAPTKYLDSLRTLILADSVKFEKAAKLHSEDKATLDSGGMLADPESRAFKLPFDSSMDPSLYFTLDSMTVGKISPPIQFRTEDGKNAVRIVYYKKRHEPHFANMKDDFQKLSTYAIGQKKSKVTDKWIENAIKEVFINVASDYEDCNIFKKPAPDN